MKTQRGDGSVGYEKPYIEIVEIKRDIVTLSVQDYEDEEDSLDWGKM